MEIHGRIRQIIEEKDLSISKFERIIGAGQNAVSTCLRRHSSVSHEVLIGIAKNFPEYSLDWIFTGKNANNEAIVVRMKDKIRELENELNKIK
ncbi:MAG: hypothetical protein O2810_02125 [Bacteroidetes bacterium]|nr:hypothetical protein [Bacteroidota bacterium]MDA0888192.1 hypothetical protein [Bacteroidota bacterium]MDA1084314.1 hypothetical protein [Bacteroidota bacterium]